MSSQLYLKNYYSANQFGPYQKITRKRTRSSFSPFDPGDPQKKRRKKKETNNLLAAYFDAAPARAETWLREDKGENGRRMRRIERWMSNGREGGRREPKPAVRSKIKSSAKSPRHVLIIMEALSFLNL
ncbi:hypothetical protein GW17_00027081 [Ensete ventricosum]|nr:hypothetical protein GW17_00027081 [Ensete ventricosum]